MTTDQNSERFMKFIKGIECWVLGAGEATARGGVATSGSHQSDPSSAGLPIAEHQRPDP